jgi:hypothetical protein
MSAETKTLEAIISSLSTESQKKVDRLKVRECDEEPKGTFIAYVDDAEISYDVMITTGKGNMLAAHSCECSSGKKLCIHRVALISFLINAGQKKFKSKILRGVKKSPYAALLDSIDHEELKMWLSEVFTKSKDFELAFFSRFRPSETRFEEADVDALTQQGRKAVIKNRRKADVSEVKKIVELWKGLHKPVIEFYQQDPASLQNFKLLKALVTGVLNQHHGIDTTSKAFLKYVKTMLSQNVESVKNLLVESSWEKAIDLFITQIGDEGSHAREYFLQFLLDLTEVSSDDRKKVILRKIISYYNKNKSSEFLSEINQHILLLDLIVTSGLFLDHYTFFKPLLYKNEYNLKLIDLLIEAKLLAKAESIAKEQININIRFEFSLPYLFRLKKIYNIQKDERRLAEVAELLFPVFFDYDDFLLMKKFKKESEWGAWETKLYTRARSAASQGSVKAEIFCYELLHAQKKFSKMLDLVKEANSIVSFIHYFEELFQTDAPKFLTNLLQMSNRYGGWVEYEDSDKEFIAVIAEQIRSHYSEKEIQKTINAVMGKSHFFRLGKLLKILSQT